MGLPHFSDSTPSAPSGARNVRWQRLSGTDFLSANIPVMTGDSGSGGVAGLVPAPVAGDAAAGKVLKADGTWYVPVTNPMTDAGDMIIGGTSGMPTRLAAGTAGQVLTAGGAGVAPNWATPSAGSGSGSPADTPPTSPTVWDDEFSGSSLDSKWAWLQQSSGVTAPLSNGDLVLTSSAGGSASSYPLSILGQAVPSSTPYAFAAKLWNSTVVANNSNAGLVLYNSTSGKLIMLAVSCSTSAQNIVVQRWNSISSWNATLKSITSLEGFWSYIYAKIVYDGTYFSYYISRDGLAYYQITSEANYSFQVSVTHVGLCIYNGDAGALTCNVGWFRRTT